MSSNSFSFGSRGDSVLSEFAFVVFKEEALHIGENTTLCNSCHCHQFVEFLIVADSQLQVTGSDCLFLVLTGSIASKLQNFTSEVFEHRSSEDASANTHIRCVTALLDVASRATNWENQVAP